MNGNQCGGFTTDISSSIEQGKNKVIINVYVTFTEGEVGEAGYSSQFVLMYHQHLILINILIWLRDKCRNTSN